MSQRGKIILQDCLTVSVSNKLNKVDYPLGLPSRIPSYQPGVTRSHLTVLLAAHACIRQCFGLKYKHTCPRNTCNCTESVVNASGCPQLHLARLEDGYNTVKNSDLCLNVPSMLATMTPKDVPMMRRA